MTTPKSKHLRLMTLVCDHFEIKPEEISIAVRSRKISHARNAFFLLSDCLDFPRKESALLLSWTERKIQLALSQFRKTYKQNDIEFRNNIDRLYETAVKCRLLGDNPTTPQLYCGVENTPRPDTLTKGTNKASDCYDCPGRKISLGFKFSKREEQSIKEAILSAVDFMDRYGRGATIPDIDYSHYIN